MVYRHTVIKCKQESALVLHFKKYFDVYEMACAGNAFFEEL